MRQSRFGKSKILFEFPNFDFVPLQLNLGLCRLLGYQLLLGNISYKQYRTLDVRIAHLQNESGFSGASALDDRMGILQNSDS